MMRPTSPDPSASPTSSSRDGQASPCPATDWRMRYQMGCIELVGWMILGGFVGQFVCVLAIVSLAKALGLPTWFLGYEGALLLIPVSIIIGAAVPIVVYCRGKQK
jgi:hypothetical protein